MTDTANKRISAVHVGLPWRGMLPFPDGTLDANDRATLAYLYAAYGVVSTIEVSFAGAGSLSSLALNTKTGAATFAGNGVLSADSGKSKLVEALLAGVSDLTLIGNLNARMATLFGGAGSLSVDTAKSKLAAAIFSGAGSESIYANLNAAIIEVIFDGMGWMDSELRKPGYIQPDADIDLDGWTDELNGTTNIFNSINEADPDDNDYVQSPGTEAVSNDLKVRLFQGAVQIAEWTHTDISETFQNAMQVLTQEQFDAITNFNDLFVELDDNLGNVYRFSLSDPASGVNEPVALNYRYKKLVA